MLDIAQSFLSHGHLRRAVLGRTAGPQMWGGKEAAQAFLTRLNVICKKISFERGPWGERGPGRARAPKRFSKLKPFWRARGAPSTPFTPRTPFKGNCVLTE